MKLITYCYKGQTTIGAVSENNAVIPLSAVAGDRSSMAMLCSRIRVIGPPNYRPTYMIRHGMGAFIGGSGNGLVADFDPAAAWEESLDTYLHCPKP